MACVIIDKSESKIGNQLLSLVPFFLWNSAPESLKLPILQFTVYQ